MVQWFLYHYGNPVIIALSVISIVDVIFVGKNKQNLILSFVATLINITIFASRWMLLEFIVILALCLLFRYHFRIISAIRNNRRIFMFIAAGAILLIFITSQRKMSSGNSTILENIYYYFWGSIACMGAHIENVDNYIMYNGHTWGQLYFSGIMGVCKDILQPIFHINIRPGIEVLNEVVQGYVYVSPKIRMNNNVTMITAFYFDGGGYAIALFSGMTAWFVARLYNKMNRSGTTNKLAYFIFAYSLLLFGLIEWMPARATNIWVFIIIAIIYRIRRIKIK
ncbi:MAG TPA: hypothetical protein DC053_09275 [Lachnoclostridium sp.]|nr:hypothetical protein [Lachnoclostridium sp.]